MHFVSQDLKKKVQLKDGKKVATEIFSKKHRVSTVN